MCGFEQLEAISHVTVYAQEIARNRNSQAGALKVLAIVQFLMVMHSESKSM